MSATVTPSGPAPDAPTPGDGELRASIRAVAAVCRAAAEGDLEPRVPPLGDDPEAVEVRAALNRLLDLTDAFVREAGASLTHAAEGRFYRRFLSRGMAGSFRAGAEVINRATRIMADSDRRLQEAAEARRRLAGELDLTVRSVSEGVAAAATEMEASVAQVAQTTRRSAQHAQDVAKASVQASSAVVSLASGVEELVATVGSIEEQANATRRVGEDGAVEAERALEAIHELETASASIGRIVTLISDVASQTRLLALNATIEAARAGDAGEGFGVVASEVKSLAVQTAKATEQITAQIGAMQKLVGRAVGVIERVADGVRAMSERADQVAGAVADQRVATTDMSQSTQTAARASEVVSSGVGSIVGNVHETNLAMEQMSEAAEELARISTLLNQEVVRVVQEL